jgi:hypothetical protein
MSDLGTLDPAIDCFREKLNAWDKANSVCICRVSLKYIRRGKYTYLPIRYLLGWDVKLPAKRSRALIAHERQIKRRLDSEGDVAFLSGERVNGPKFGRDS